MNLFSRSKSKDKSKKGKDISVEFEDTLDKGRRSIGGNSSKKSFASSAGYSTDPNGPPDFGGNVDKSKSNFDQSLNDRSSSFPVDVYGKVRGDSSAQRSGSNNSGRPSPNSRLFQKSGDTQKTTPNKSLQKLNARSGFTKEPMSPIESSNMDNELSLMDPVSESKNLTSPTKKYPGMAPLDLNDLSDKQA